MHADDEQVRDELEAVGETLHEAMGTVRASVHDLHDDAFDLRAQDVYKRQAEDYQKARARRDPRTAAVKNQAQGLLDLCKQALEQVGGQRIDAAPPGRLGVVVMVANMKMCIRDSPRPDRADGAVDRRVALRRRDRSGLLRPEAPRMRHAHAVQAGAARAARSMVVRTRVARRPPESGPCDGRAGDRMEAGFVLCCLSGASAFLAGSAAGAAFAGEVRKGRMRGGARTDACLLYTS